MTTEELQQLLTERFGDHVTSSAVAWGQLTVTLDAEGYAAAARFCRDDPRVDCDFFDCLVGVDEREQGFAVIAILYSTTTRQRVLLRHLCAGGRDRPVAPTLTHLYRGADWHEREAWDMFGIEFDGHPALAPRLLTTENFEGWPLRKDFPLATREAKAWPGAKEPAEVGTESEREEALVSTVTSAGITGDQEEGARETAAAKAERARQKAAELRRQKAAERTAQDAAVPAASGEEPAEARPAGAAEADRLASVASDPRVSRPEDRAGGGHDLGGARHRTADAAPADASEGEPATPAGTEATDGAPPEAGPGDADRSAAESDPGAGPGDAEGSAAETDAERAARAVAESHRAHEQRGIGVYDQTSVPGERTAGAGDAGELGGAYLGGPPAPPAGPQHPHEQGTTWTGAEGERLGRPTTKHAGEEVDPPADEPRPGAKAGEPPETQTPGLAPVDGGIHEHIDRQAEAGPGMSGGERPQSTQSPAVTSPPPVPEEAPTVLELGGDRPTAESLGPSGPQPVGEAGAGGAPGDRRHGTPQAPEALSPTDLASTSLPDQALDTLRGEQPGPRPSDADLAERMPPDERARRDPATPGGEDPTAASGVTEAESRHGPPEEGDEP